MHYHINYNNIHAINYVKPTIPIFNKPLIRKKFGENIIQLLPYHNIINDTINTKINITLNDILYIDMPRNNNKISVQNNTITNL